MNRELFKADMNQIRRRWPEDVFADKLADYVETIIENEARAVSKSKVDKEAVLSVCLEHFGMSLEKMQTKSRMNAVRHPRQVTMFLLYHRTMMSYADIGHFFFKDHTSVISACRRIDELMLTEEQIRNEVKLLDSKI